MWLLELQILKRILKAEEKGFVPTEEQVSRHLDMAADSGSSPTRIMSVAGDKAEIAIQGVLTKAPDFFAMLFGGGNTTYADINASLAAAEADSEVTEITFNIDSPGGSMNGLFETLSNIRGMSKPTRAVVSGNALSAAYGIAAQTDKILAINSAAGVGSIGVAVDTFVFDNEVSIASTEAPKKRPDLKTEAGKKVVRERLDSLHSLFVDEIAAGRTAATGKTFTAKDVNRDFGRGAILVARDGLEKGMVDSIINEGAKAVGDAPEKAEDAVNGDIMAGQTPLVDKSKTQAHVDKNRDKIKGEDEEANSTHKEDRKMDLTTLKRDHAAIYEEAKADGVKQERDRATAHLVMGQEAGAMKEAIEAVTKGTEMTLTMQSTYMSAGMKKKDIEDRGDDDVDTGTAVEGVKGEAGSPDAWDKMADETEAAFGVEKGAGV